jgi:hypothetical protein
MALALKLSESNTEGLAQKMARLDQFMDDLWDPCTVRHISRARELRHVGRGTGTTP